MRRAEKVCTALGLRRVAGDEALDLLNALEDWAREHGRLSWRTLRRRFMMPREAADIVLTELVQRGVLVDPEEDSYRVYGGRLVRGSGWTWRYRHAPPAYVRELFDEAPARGLSEGAGHDITTVPDEFARTLTDRDEATQADGAGRLGTESLGGRSKTRATSGT